MIVFIRGGLELIFYVIIFNSLDLLDFCIVFAILADCLRPAPQGRRRSGPTLSFMVKRQVWRSLRTRGRSRGRFYNRLSLLQQKYSPRARLLHPVMGAPPSQNRNAESFENTIPCYQEWLRDAINSEQGFIELPRWVSESSGSWQWVFTLGRVLPFYLPPTKFSQ